MTRRCVSVCALLGIAASLLVGTPLAHAQSTTSPFPYGSEKVRGVSLGGWLILHPWIRPSLFENLNDSIIDEWTFCQLQNRSVAEAALKSHWDTFYCESDFAAMAKAGLNHVRIPIGYWAFEVAPGEPYIQGQIPYLKRAIGWAAKYGLKVNLDLYGAPGSQNGFINSGHIISFPQWQSNATYIARTKAIIKTMADMFSNETNVVSIIGTLNEPAGFDGDDILSDAREYYEDSYNSVRFPNNSTEPSDTIVMIQTGFQPFSYWDGFMTPPAYERVMMDQHVYQGFPDTNLTLTQDEHIAYSCSLAAGIADFDLPVVVGEWAPMITDCAAWINGRNTGASWDGTLANSTRLGSCDGLSGYASTFSTDYKTFLRKYWEAQTLAFEAGEGWIHWPWKTAAGAGEEWSYEKGLEYGWIPKNASDPSQRQYPNICD